MKLSLDERLRALRGEPEPAPFDAAEPAFDGIKRPLEDRLGAVRVKTETPVSKETVVCVLHGFGQLSGRASYMDWLSKRLLTHYNAAGDYPYENLVHHADKLINMDAYTEEGYELMFQLLIEPLHDANLRSG